jgi:molybdate transport system substrate-binding protein
MQVHIMHFSIYRTLLILILFSVFQYPAASAQTLHLFAGAGMRQPIEELVETFEEREGITVYVDYGGSGQLMTRIIASDRGDLFIPGAFFYIEELNKKGLIDSWKPIVSHTPVVGVNRKKIHLIRSFEDLAKPGVRIALGDPKAMAFGRIASDILKRSGMEEAILKNVIVQGVTVKQLALYVANGDVDASIIGRADAFQFEKYISIVQIPDAFFQADTIAIAHLKHGSAHIDAIRFMEYISKREAIKVFTRFGFLPLSVLKGH